MSPEETKQNDRREPSPEQVRLLCLGCGHWTEVGRNGPGHIFTGHLLPDDPEAKAAAVPSASFMYRHLTQCKRPVVAIYRENPRWHTLVETNHEYESDAC